MKAFYYFARTDVTSSTNGAELLAYSSGGEIRSKGVAGLSEKCEGPSVLCLPPLFWWLADNHGCSLASKSTTLVPTFMFTRCLLVRVCAQIPSFPKDTHHIGLGPILSQSDGIITNDICCDIISK